MSIFAVTEKATGRLAYRYSADAPAEQGFPFDAYDHQAEAGEAPAPVAPAAPRWITPQAFQARFTPMERAKIELAATDVPSAAVETRLQAAGLRAEWRRVTSSRFIDLDLLDTRNGVISLAALLDAPERVGAILDTEPTDGERYVGPETVGA